MDIKDICTVAKKELRSFFTDKIILLQILILPFAIVFGYSMLMGGMSSSFNEENAKAENSYFIGAPAEMKKGLEELGLKETDRTQAEKIKNKIKNKDNNFLIMFPDNFILAQNGSDNMPDVEMWYNSESTESMKTFENTNELLNSFQPKAFTVNRRADTVKYNFGDENYEFRRFMGMVFPMMVFMAVFMVCMNLAANSVAGDKERGFLNTVLITPVKRSSVAFGKSVSLFAAAILGSLSAFTGMVASLPNLSESLHVEGNMSYSISEYIVLFLITVTAIFVLTGFLLIVSALAKDVKQATTISPIILMVLIICTMLTMNDNFNDIVSDLGFVNNYIPIWNSVNLMQRLLQMNYSAVEVLISCAVNLTVTVILIIVLSQLFKNEKILNG